jgi:predicted transposase
MKTTLTTKLKLLTTPDQFSALRATQLAYRDALNYVSAYAFAHRKTSSGKRLQKATYNDLRRQFGLPAQMACNVPRQVGATYKGLWTKTIKNAEARRLGYTKRRFKGLDKAPHYVSPTLTYTPSPRLFAARRTRAEPADAGGTDPCALPGLESPRGPAPEGSDSRGSQALV